MPTDTPLTPKMPWICEGCGARFAEYINGCPHCYEGRQARGLFPLHARVVFMADLPPLTPTQRRLDEHDALELCVGPFWFVLEEWAEAKRRAINSPNSARWFMADRLLADLAEARERLASVRTEADSWIAESEAGDSEHNLDGHILANAFIYDWVLNKVGAGTEQAAGLIDDFRKYRLKRTGKRSGMEVLPETKSGESPEKELKEGKA